jgi:quercetin dioxygenase-like cupin family protein
MKTSLHLSLALAVGIGLGVGGMQVLQAEQQAITRNVLQHADLTGVPGTEVYMTLIDAAPGTSFAPHVHHGDEFTYVLQGSLDLDVAGEGSKTVKAGDSIHVARETVHGGKVSGSTPVKLLAIHVVDKGKPLADPVK